jgi:hypothetical protein
MTVINLIDTISQAYVQAYDIVSIINYLQEFGFITLAIRRQHDGRS